MDGTSGANRSDAPRSRLARVNSSFTQMFQLPGGDGDDHEEDFEREAPPMPAWFGPPEDELGGVIPLDLVIGRSPDGVVALPHVTVYSTGVAFEFIAVARGLSNANSNGVLQKQHGPKRGKEPPPRFLRLGLELSGGERVSNLGGKVHRRRFLKPDEKPDGAVFFEHGGRGGAGGWRTRENATRVLAVAPAGARHDPSLLRVAGRRDSALGRRDRVKRVSCRSRASRAAVTSRFGLT
jgi:hypothetical protein